jgi:hypothetical protein
MRVEGVCGLASDFGFGLGQGVFSSACRLLSFSVARDSWLTPDGARQLVVMWRNLGCLNARRRGLWVGFRLRLRTSTKSMMVGSGRYEDLWLDN